MRKLLAVASLLAMATGLTACDDGSGGQPSSTGTPTAAPTTPVSPSATPSVADSPTVGPSPQPTPTSTAAGTEARALAVQRNALVEVAVPTGEVLAEVQADLGEGASSLVHSPERNSLLFSRTATGARQEIVEVILDGDGQEQVVTTGHAVGVAPDGRRLAVARHETRDDGPDQEVVEVRSFDGEVLGRWADPVAAEEPVRASHLTWSPDGTRLAFQLRFEDGTEVRTLDPDAAGGSLQQDTRQVPAPGDLRLLTAPQFRPETGRLAVVDGPGLDPDAEQVWRISTLEPDTGEVAEVLVETERAVTALDFDPAGDRLLYVEGHAHTPGQDDQAGDAPILLHWREGTTTEVARGLADVAW